MSRTLSTAAALLALASAGAHAGTFTVYTGMHCQSEGLVDRPVNGALHNVSAGHTTTTDLFRCPVHRTQPLAYTGTLLLTVNVLRNKSAANWDCTLRAVDPQGNVDHAVTLYVPPWTGGPKTWTATSAPLNLAGLPSAAPHSVSLRCNVPDMISGESAAIVSYWITELE